MKISDIDFDDVFDIENADYVRIGFQIGGYIRDLKRNNTSFILMKTLAWK